MVHRIAGAAALAALLVAPAALGQTAGAAATEPGATQPREIVVPQSSRPQPPGYAHTNTLLALPTLKIDAPPTPPPAPFPH